MSSLHDFIPATASDSIARALKLSPEIVDRAKHLPDHPLAKKAIHYAKAHPGKAAFAAIGALWLAKKILR